MTIMEFIGKFIIFLIGLYFIISETYKLLFTEMTADVSLNDSLSIFIFSLKFTFIFIALPLFYVHKILEYFDIIPSVGFEIRLYYMALYFIICVLILIRALEFFLAKFR